MLSAVATLSRLPFQRPVEQSMTRSVPRSCYYYRRPFLERPSRTTSIGICLHLIRRCPTMADHEIAPSGDQIIALSLSDFTSGVMSSRWQWRSFSKKSSEQPDLVSVTNVGFLQYAPTGTDSSKMSMKNFTKQTEHSTIKLAKDLPI